jgi:citrate lyase beta subunit
VSAFRNGTTKYDENEGFACPPADVEAAARIVSAWNAGRGTGVIQVDGKMIDRPVVLAAVRPRNAVQPTE